MPTDVERLLDEDVGAPPTFDSERAELAWWKQRAAEYRAALKETHYDFSEFQADSKDYEEELEQNMDVLEAQNKELKGLVNMLQIESEHWKTKAKEAQVDHNAAQQSLQREVDFLKQQQKEYMERTRTLELDNDDLERSGRAMESSRRDLELRVASLKERNAFLEHEMEVKQKLVVVVQRLKDELRDVQLELSVLKNKRSSFKRRSLEPAAGKGRAGMLTPNSSEGEVSGRAGGDEDAADGAGTAPLREGQGAMNAVRAVQDMLGRVRTLESRLVNCRKLVNPMIQTPPASGRRSLSQGATAGHSGIPPRHLDTGRMRAGSESGSPALGSRPSTGSSRDSSSTLTIDPEMIRQRAAARRQRMEEFDRMKRRRSEQHAHRASLSAAAKGVAVAHGRG